MIKKGINFNNDLKVEISQGEELLHQVYNPIQAKGRVEKVVVGFDGGSTQTRVTLMRRADESDGSTLDEVYVIPSEMSMATGVGKVNPKGEELYHKMESLITHNGLKSDQIFDKSRVIRGTKLLELSQSINRINSSISKVDTPAFYLNLLDAFGYAIIMDSARRGVPLAETYEIHASVSLPPNDKRSQKALTKFLNNFINPFNWASLDLGVNFTISVKNCVVTTEPGSAVRYVGLVDEDIDLYSSTILGIDGGGRSMGTDVIIEGVPTDALSEAFDYGGTQLAQLIRNDVVSKYGLAPKEKDVKRAIVSGKLKLGNTDYAIDDIVIKCKKELGQKIYADLLTVVFDAGKIGIRDVNMVVFTGRLFDAGDYDFSIADYIMTLFMQSSPDVKYKVISGEYTIPSGNLAYAFNEFGHVLNDNIEVSPLPYDEDEEEFEDEVATDYVNA